MGLINLSDVYRYHSPTDEQQRRYRQLRVAGKAFAEAIVDLTPQSREQSVALTNVQQATMWANAAIAINEQESV